MKKLFGLIVLITILLPPLKLCRSKYMPLINKPKGKETSESIITELESKIYERLRNNFNSAGFFTLPTELVLVGLKEERRLEIYGKDQTGTKLIKAYPFTAYSGQLGPKLKEGDRQIPEGIYKVEYLNPNSSYYLSIKVDYPNAFDIEKTKLSSLAQMGGDIFIHGKAATIGCIPIGDEAIEEVFVLAQKAKNKDIKVIISPRDFRVNKIFPKIENIDWENELYEIITNELMLIPKVK